MSYDLTECPHCRSTDLAVGHAHALAFHVWCRECGARTRPFEIPNEWPPELPETGDQDDLEAYLKERAKEAWNRRDGELGRPEKCEACGVKHRPGENVLCPITIAQSEIRAEGAEQGRHKAYAAVFPRVEALITEAEHRFGRNMTSEWLRNAIKAYRHLVNEEEAEGP
jgi:hypothetical protein